MEHPSDSPAWKHFNSTYPDFAAKSRDVRLGICTNGFSPFGQYGGQYSCWPVILTPYNLPPGMCMKGQFMFQIVLIPGPDSPKQKLDVFLQPLIAELKQLWEVGVLAYDISSKKNFHLRAALLWIVSHFPTYSMLSDWNTGGKLAFPYCMEDTYVIRLETSKKQLWLDCHRRFLPMIMCSEETKQISLGTKWLTRDHQFFVQGMKFVKR